MRTAFIATCICCIGTILTCALEARAGSVLDIKPKIDRTIVIENQSGVIDFVITNIALFKVTLTLVTAGQPRFADGDMDDAVTNLAIVNPQDCVGITLGIGATCPFQMAVTTRDTSSFVDKDKGVWLALPSVFFKKATGFPNEPEDVNSGLAFVEVRDPNFVPLPQAAWMTLAVLPLAAMGRFWMKLSSR